MAWSPTRPPGARHRSERLEVRGPPPLPHRFNHFNTDDGVVGSHGISIVLHPDIDHVAQLFGRYSMLAPRRACSWDRVMLVTRAPLRAARRANSPHPVPISSTRVPRRTPVASSNRSIL